MALAAWKKATSVAFGKPSWRDAPEWAKYLTQDYDNTWWWHEFEPYVPKHSSVGTTNSGRFRRADKNNRLGLAEKRGWQSF